MEKPTPNDQDGPFFLTRYTLDGHVAESSAIDRSAKLSPGPVAVSPEGWAVGTHARFSGKQHEHPNEAAVIQALR